MDLAGMYTHSEHLFSDANSDNSCLTIASWWSLVCDSRLTETYKITWDDCMARIMQGKDEID